MKKYLYSKKNRLIAHLVFLIFLSCQSSTWVTASSPYPYALDDFKLEYFYGKFVGSNKTATFGTKNPDDGSHLWNNCIDFKQPSAVSPTSYVNYEWRSPNFKHRKSGNNGITDVYFPITISNENNTPTPYVTSGYFFLRYDITDNILDLTKDTKGKWEYDKWEPTTDSNIISGIKKILAGFMEKDNTLQGKTAFQIVYFRTNDNSIKQNKMEEVELNFGSTLEFKKTTELPSGGNELRNQYEAIAKTLIDKTKNHIAAYQGPFWAIYRRTEDDFDKSSIAKFEDNDKTKFCPASE